MNLRLVHSHLDPEPPIRFGSALVRILVECASRNTGLAVREITGWGRHRDIVWTRWAIAKVARENGRSLPQIGEGLNRDHTTILHGLERIKTIHDRDFEDLLTILRAEAAR